ncbi:hypothetical protein RUM43_001164, partial [Polyplax serrata]
MSRKAPPMESGNGKSINGKLEQHRTGTMGTTPVTFFQFQLSFFMKLKKKGERQEQE